MLATVRRAVSGVVLALAVVVPASARAQDTGTYSSDPLDWGAGPGDAWVDFNGDRNADYCRIDGGARLLCTLSTGRGWGATITAPAHDPGYGDGRLWGDVDGNGGADYCRRVGNGGADSRYECTFSQGNAFSFTTAALTLDWGALPGAALADVTGDGHADYCRVTGDHVTCSDFGPSGFGPGFASPTLDVGAEAGRAWVDFNGDGKADFCRVVASTIACTPSTGTGFAGTTTSFALDVGYEPGRAWADVNGDGKADYCRRVGGGNDPTLISCTLSTGTGFGQTLVSKPLDWGNDSGAAWVDFDGDGDRDFCRSVTASPTNQQLFCTLWSPNGLGDTIVSGPIDIGYDGDRAWVDFNGDGKADYCRRTGVAPSDERVTCTTSTGTGFGPLPVPVTPPTQQTPPPVQSPTPRPRIVVLLSYDYKANRRSTLLTRLVVKGVPKGSTVKATCRKGCSRKTYTRRNAHGTISLKVLIKKRLKAGTVIKVTVSRPGSITAHKTLRIRAGKRPKVS